MPRWFRRFSLLALLAAALSGHAATFRGVVSRVTDGDTLWVRPGGHGEAVRIRLVDLDAPENCQAFGPQARRALAGRVLNQTVVVRTRGLDDYQRTLAQLRHRGFDVNAWLVREGFAWSATLRGRRGPYAALEDEARQARRGLWANGGAIEPRQFRRTHGPCR